jgi:hypothetical protein
LVRALATRLGEQPHTAPEPKTLNEALRGGREKGPAC